MTDTVSRAKRSEIMAAVGSRDTSPEMRVRRLLWSMGFRYRLHRSDLPGCPDIVFSSRRLVLFVHGCFWHRHPGCSRTRSPKTRREFWEAKFARNVARDASVVNELEGLGWNVLLIWECETTDEKTLRRRLAKELRVSATP